MRVLPKKCAVRDVAGAGRQGVVCYSRAGRDSPGDRQVHYEQEVRTVTAHLHVNMERLAEFSERNRVSELAVFGSALREDFTPDSDVDILITFLPDAEVSLFDLVDMADELSCIVGRRVDLVPKHGLKPQIRQPVLESAHILYAAA